jgi:hypothetical protein
MRWRPGRQGRRQLQKGLRDRKVFEKIHESGTTAVVPLMDVINKLIDTKEALIN